MGLNKGDLVEVVWRDAVSHGLKEAYEIDDNYTPGYINKDVGYFLTFHKKFIIIGMEQGQDEDHYRGLT
jgi:hypothetical protein